MATTYTFDPVKAAQASALIKSGIDEEEAFKRAGIPEEAYYAYTIDAVPGSPTNGQVIKGYDVTVYDEAEQKARDEANAKKEAQQEAEREARAKEREQERQKEREQYKREREAELAASKKGWSDEEDKAETAGPANTRKDVTTTVSGGGVRETRMTAEMTAWSEKARAADKADADATQAAKNEYLRSLGLDQSTFREKNKALREAEASGKNFAVTTSKDALGPPPANQYEDVTIRPNVDGKQVPNDGVQTDEQAAATRAEGQTAEAAVANSAPPVSPGAGSTPTPAETLSDQETKKITTNAQNSQDELPPNAFPGPGGVKSEKAAEDPGAAKKEESKNKSITGATSNTKAVDPGKDISQQQKELSQKIALAKTNKLHDFASYTYRLTLYLLSTEDYAALIDKPSKFNPKYALISSGGGYANKPTYNWNTGTNNSGRHPDFQEDFFIDNLNLQTVVGLNARTKASNAIDIGFTIIEPYGMTLLDRLLSACLSIGSKNYIDQPYLLEIDFLTNPTEAVTGSDGKTKTILIDRKRIPIKIMQMKIKPGPSGTEYKCTAIPYNHAAFQDSIASVPITINVTAGTVGEFFDSDVEIQRIFTDGVPQVDEERIETEAQKWSKDNFNEMTPATASDIEGYKNRLRAAIGATSKSFPAAYNSYMRSIAGENKTFAYPPSLLTINIADPELKESLIVDENNTEVRTVPMADTVEGIAASVRAGMLKDGKTKQIFPVSPGTHVVQLIDRVMQTSSYITKQVKDPKESVAYLKEQIAYHSKNKQDDSLSKTVREEAAREEEKAQQELKKFKFIDWYKIIPQVFIKEFDQSRNAYSKMATYSIVKYKAANAYHPDFAKTKIGKSKIVRSYNYLYTGLNTDILSIDIDFDSTYYTAITAYQESKQRAGARYGTAITDASNVISEDNALRDLDPSKANPDRTSDIPHSYGTRGANNSAAGQMNRANNSISQAVSDMANSIYTSQRGDMLNVKLKITGDPAFIKQDDVYYNPMSSEYQDYAIVGSAVSNGEETVPINATTGQIVFDAEQVFVQLIIKSAVDIDDKTGITNKQIKLSTGRMTDSTFSGVYKVLKVSSDLSKGRFEQTLELVKMPNDLFFDDVPVNSSKTVVRPKVAAAEETPTVPPPAASTTNQLADNTGLSDKENAALKDAAAQAPIPPIASFSGESTTASAPLPTQAAPANANDAPAVAPQEQPAPDVTASLSQYESEINNLQAQRNDEITSFNATLRNIRNDSTLTAQQKTDKIIAYREALQTVLSEQADAIAQLSIKVFGLKTASVSDQSSKQLKLLTRLSGLQKETTEFYKDQTAKIKAAKETGVA